MFVKLLLLFTIVPIVELIVLIKLSQVTNLWFTIGVILVTGIVGAYLAKSQGSGIFRRIKMELSRGGIPGDELINGAFVLVGGAMLLTPGLLTDAMGFIFVMPYTRRLIKIWGKRKLKAMIEGGRFNIYWR